MMTTNAPAPKLGTSMAMLCSILVLAVAGAIFVGTLSIKPKSRET